jgi:hypothetical protein
VEKIVLLSREQIIAGAKKRNKTVKTRVFDCFEMTWSPENYRGYTPIEPFVGESYEDLNNNIDKFLKNLMTEINTPLKDCPNCDGAGVVKS